MRTHPRLATEHLRLRPFVAEDAEPLARHGSARAIADAMLDWPHPFSNAIARSTIAAQAASFQAGRSVHFAVQPRDAAELIGGVELAALDPDNQRAELRFWIAESAWGRGLASEAAGAVLRFCFSELALHRVDALHLVRSAAGGAVLRKIGMRQEGLLRERVRKYGVFEDVALYAALAGDARPTVQAGDHAFAAASH
jgi:RimJ/RimL family protein N-acetyltransferase